MYQKLLSFPPYEQAQSVAIFLSMPSSEIQTDAIVRHAFGAGKQVYVPYLHRAETQVGSPLPTPARVMDMVRLESVQDYEALRRDKWGIPSVDAETASKRPRVLSGHAVVDRKDAIHLDLVLMPGVAFDRDAASGQVRRLGHGRGFYDFFIHRYLLSVSVPTEVAGDHPIEPPPRLRLYGLALTEQFLVDGQGEEVPVGPQDQPLDGVLLGSGAVVESESNV